MKPTSHVAVAFACLTLQTVRAYRLDAVYDASNFLTEVEFFPGPDPAHGYVNYNPAGGRKSVRPTSRKKFTHGLAVADIAHMPGGACGTWPAFWMFGPNWPNSGEIDILEGVNSQRTISVALHTSSGCHMALSGGNGSVSPSTTGCSTKTSGCSFQTTDGGNYGDGLNSIGGGVYAPDWTPDSITMWFFPRRSILSDIASRIPRPESWRSPLARFTGGAAATLTLVSPTIKLYSTPRSLVLGQGIIMYGAPTRFVLGRPPLSRGRGKVPIRFQGLLLASQLSHGVQGELASPSNNCCCAKGVRRMRE